VDGLFRSHPLFCRAGDEGASSRYKHSVGNNINLANTKTMGLLLTLRRTPAISDRTSFIINTRPAAWEWRLFAQALIDEVDRLKRLKKGPPEGIPIPIPLQSIGPWSRSRIRELASIVQKFGDIWQERREDAFGSIGKPGDPRAILRLAVRVAKLYREAIEWTHSIQLAELAEMCWEVQCELACLADPLIEAVEQLGPTIIRQIDEAAARPRNKPVRIVITVILQAPNADPVIAALDRVTASL
jgi:hypothetical protein